MIRNLKALGVAMAAVFAMSAVVASGASAQTQGKLTMNGGTEVTLDAMETGQNAFTAFDMKVECVGSVITGHKITTTPHASVPSKAQEVTLTPHFVNCHAIDGLGTHKVTITMTSCDLHAKIGQTTGGVANTYGVNFGVTCNTAEDTIDIEVYALPGNELGGVRCTIRIKAQEDLTGAHITTSTLTDDLNMNGTVTKIHAERSGSGCSTTTTDEAAQDVNVTVRGTDRVGSFAGITITD